MKVLVTGGAGYIGSRTVGLLRERGHEVVVLDNMESGYREAIADTPLVEGDVRNESLLDAVLGARAIDAVIHFAGYKAAGESIDQPGRYFDNNVCGALCLLRAMQKASIRYLVFSSSCAVYGTPRTLPVSEQEETRPESPYGESKLMVERMLQWYDACHGMRVATLRYFNAAGASLDGQAGEDWTHSLNLVPLVLKVALGVIPSVRVFGTDYPTPDGTAIRDYIHVLDLAEAHIKALEYLENQNESFTVNVGTGQGSSVQQVIDTARRISGAVIPIEYTARRPGDPAAIYADNRRAAKLLAWHPHFGLTEIIESAWRWHKAYPNGYRS